MAPTTGPPNLRDMAELAKATPAPTSTTADLESASDPEALASLKVLPAEIASAASVEALAKLLSAQPALDWSLCRLRGGLDEYNPVQHSEASIGTQGEGEVDPSGDPLVETESAPRRGRLWCRAANRA